MALVEVVLRGERLCFLIAKNPIEGVQELLSFDSSLAISPRHAAKALEVTLFAHSRGEGLRNIKYEFYRRLLLTRELRKLPLPQPEKEGCRIYLVECDGARRFERVGEECMYGGSSLLSEIARALGKGPRDESALEKTLLAFVEATRQGAWLID